MQLTLRGVPAYSGGMIYSPNLTNLLRGTVFQNDPSILFGTALNLKLAHLKWLNSACMWMSQAAGMDSGVQCACFLLVVFPLCLNKQIRYSAQADHL